MTDVDAEDHEKEFRLAQQIKDLYCDESGKEIEPENAAEIFHQIGRIYRKHSSDKISLIKSAGLFNAAIIRNPSNLDQVKSDLSELCQHILLQANADKQNADLIKKAEEVKMSINKLRTEVNSFLKAALPKIPATHSRIEYHKLMSNKIAAIQQINKTITASYKNIMAEISKFCEDVVGKSPCDYVIAGMGSLARDEITPYSDFEHVILLYDDENYISHLEYFRWFSVIFHVIVLNLQETIIPSLNVCSLNDENENLGDWFYDTITPRGVSFDGMMPHASKFPLGRLEHTKNKPFTTELIKPVSEMLKYLSSDANLKNGYHLADILTKTCFVFGNENIFKQFVDGVQKHKNQKSQTDNINDVEQQVKDDLNSFSARFRLSDLKSSNIINIKRLVYRSSTLFVAALASLYNLAANSCFDIINEMEQKNKITQNTAYKLQCAIAIACEMRLRIYVEKKSQCDSAINLKQDGIQKFLDVVGVACTINYFQIVYCLQCELAKQLKFTKLHFYSDPKLINFTICLAFGAKKLQSFTKTATKLVWNSVKFEFDQIIDQVEKEIDLNSIILNSSPFQLSGHFDSNIETVEVIANYLRDVEIYDEAMEFYNHLLILYQPGSNECTHHNDLANINHNIGVCLGRSDRLQEALTYYTKSLHLKSAKTKNAKKDMDIAMTLNDIGLCHVYLFNYNVALTYLNRALQIKQNATFNAEKDKHIAATLNNIGLCHNRLNNYSNALLYLNRALQIYQNATLNAEKDKSIAWTLGNIGLSYYSLYNCDDALTYFKQALHIQQNATPNAENDRNIASTLNNIGNCHKNLSNYGDALTNLNQALKIYQKATLNAEYDKDIALTLNNIGICHHSLHKYDDALTYLNRALQIKQNATLNVEKDRDIAGTLNNIGSCYKNLCNYDNALTYLDRAFKIYQNATLNADTDKEFATTLHNVGECHLGLHKYTHALSYLNRALQIKQNATLNTENDKDIASTLDSIGKCHTNLHKCHNALIFLNQALQIKQNATLNAEKDRDIAGTLNNIGICYIYMSNYDNALIYLNRALQIKQKTTLNAEKDRSIASTLNNIGSCHRNLCNYDDSLTCLNRALQIFHNAKRYAENDKEIALTLKNIGLTVKKIRK